MTTACVTVALPLQRCGVWTEPACGRTAWWTIERRDNDNCTTAVVHACLEHLVDGLSNALGLPGADRPGGRPSRAQRRQQRDALVEDVISKREQLAEAKAAVTRLRSELRAGRRALEKYVAADQ